MHHRAAGAVAGVDHHFDAAREVELRGDFVDVGRNAIGGGFAAFAARKIARFHHAAELLYRLAVERGGAADGFESVELGGIVAAGDHDGAVGFEMEMRIVEHGRGDDAEIGDMAAAGLQAAHQRIAQARRTEARVAAQVDLAAGVALQVCAEGLAEEFDAGIGEFNSLQSAMPRISYSRKMVALSMKLIWNHDCRGGHRR